ARATHHNGRRASGPRRHHAGRAGRRGTEPARPRTARQRRAHGRAVDPARHRPRRRALRRRGV
ncbi:MAG: hypothetical protein AVDCRST_MAG79-2574, partial [uncultured Thermoleophilia bacterium]